MRTDDIVFKLKDGNKKDLEFRLVPLLQKEAGRVFHTSVGQLVRAISESMGSAELGSEKNIVAVAAALGNVDYDLIWGVASALCKNAVVGGNEINSLDDIEAISDAPWILYMIVFHGIKGNWPRVFSDLGAKFQGLGSQIKMKMAAMENIGA